MVLLGIDTGGTFTDFVLLQSGRLRIHKVLSTPSAPEQAILQGINELGLLEPLAEPLSIVHGSTVATNAVLEGKGVRTVFITNRGHADMLTIGRQARRELYNLQPKPQDPPVPAPLCVETGGRLSADGTAVEPLADDDITTLLQEIKLLAPRAVAINLLFSYLDDGFERRIAEAMPKALFVSRSSEILPEMREYERGITTWLNASVGPLMQQYLQRLADALPNHPEVATQLSVMQSSGGTMDAGQAGRHAVQLLLSGPAGGLCGAKYMAALSGHHRLLSFDMGGTSTDVALIDGELQLTAEGRIGDYPVSVPMVDMHTIGAGGGSIASIDAGGMLQVGPASAGADPGPACYGKGGTQATVTDANLMLGRLRPDAFLGGNMQLDCHAAHLAIAELARGLNTDIASVAEGIIRIANEHMARALRVMSVQRGIDPRELTLVSFGGAGGLHVCALADALGMRRALVPLYGGVLSALGMLVAPRERNLSQGMVGLVADLAGAPLENCFAELTKRGSDELHREGEDRDAIMVQPKVDLRYVGQSYPLTLDWQGLDATLEAFHALHEARYGHCLAQQVELVTARVNLKVPALTLQLSGAEEETTPSEVSAIQRVSLPGMAEEVPVYSRHSLALGSTLAGPALLTELVSTTLIEPGWQCQVDATQNLLLERMRD